MSCSCAGQRWWQDREKADAAKSKTVTANTGPATVSVPAGQTAVKPGTTTAPPRAAAVGRGAGRAAATAGGPSRTPPVTTAPRGGPLLANVM